MALFPKPLTSSELALQRVRLEPLHTVAARLSRLALEQTRLGDSTIGATRTMYHHAAALLRAELARVEGQMSDIRKGNEGCP